MKKFRVIFHRADLDGIGSCMVVLKWLFLQGAKVSDIELHPWDYGDPLPVYNQGDEVIIVDISLNDAWMIQLYADHERGIISAIWIDHHKTSFGNSLKYGYHHLPGHRVDHRPSAVELTWNYFFKDKYVPEGIKLLSLYDTWCNENIMEWNDRIIPFQMGMRQVWLERMIIPGNMEWTINNFFAHIDDYYLTIEAGRTIEEYSQFLNARSSARGFSFRWEGLTFAVLNEDGNSNSFVPKELGFLYDACMMFRFDGKTMKWRFSLYGVDSQGNKSPIDLSVLAKKMGGGGHAGACGFEVHSLHAIFGNEEGPASNRVL